jgi:hypothetical protein
VKREWLIFFSECRSTAWWARVFRPGWRHVAAAAYFAGAERWLYFDPVAPGLHVDVDDGEAFHARYEHLMRTSTAVLRFASQHERGAMPATFFCVGAIKALVGIRSRALSPRALYRDLLARGAEIVKAPDEAPIVEPVRGRLRPDFPARPGAGRTA